MCCTRTRPGWRCPTGSWGCRAVRPVGGGWKSGRRGGCCRPRWPSCRSSLPRRAGSTGRGCSSTPRWSRRKRGRAKVARTLTGKRGSRFHLAVDAAGRPLQVRLAAGNENERRHLLPLLDALAGRGIRPGELWADRGYHSAQLERELRSRGIEPRISRPRTAGQPIPAGTPVRLVWRGKKRRLRTADPLARQRWPIERTNAWLRNRRRIATRRDRKPENYEAFLQLAMILILARSF